MRKSLTLTTAFFCCALIGCTSKQNAQNSGNDERPNIIFILSDDLGYGDLGSYGQTKIRTPNLDKLASEGLRFTDHYAGSPVCGPSRASLLLGLHTGNSPIRGNPKWTNSGNPVELKKEDITVAEVLQQAGYQTAAIGKWGMADGKTFNLDAMPKQQGFDYFYGYKNHSDAHHYYWDKMYRNNEPEFIKENNYLENSGSYIHDILTREALSFVKRTDRNQPFFLYLAYTIPHLAVTVPEDSKVPYKNLGWPKRKMNTEGHYRNDPEGHTAYAGMVSRMDRDIGALLKTLESLGISENTLVIFSSDNGHEYDKDFFDSNGPLRGRKRDLYEGGIRVPFIARWPAKIEADQVSSHISAFWDFMPTVCELAEVEKCPSNDGLSYVPTMTGNTQQQHNYLYWEFNERQGPVQALRQDKWKLLRFKGTPAELYNLDDDVGEQNNLADAHPEKVKKLSQIMDNVRSPNSEFPLRPVERMLKKIRQKK